MYGSAFLSSYGETPPTVWEQAIIRLTHEQIGKGLATLGNENRKFPPNLSEFVHACTTILERRSNGVEDRTDYKLLRRQRSTPEFARKWIDKMKRGRERT